MKQLALAVLSTILIISNAYSMGPEHTGSWFYDAQSGHGFSIEYGDAGNGTPLVVVYWYTYDSEGFPVFLIGTGYPDENGVEVALNAHYGMVYGEFNPATVERPGAGTAIFTFQDANSGTFKYEPSDWTIEYFGHAATEMPITKLFGVSPEIIEVPVPVGGDTVVSQINGAFDGWDGDTIIELMNGQIWKQFLFHWEYTYEYLPDVVIYKKGSFYYASVEGSDTHVGVERIQ